MKLGILVVYMVDQKHEWLLDLHLNQIKKCTDVPYTIFGVPKRIARNCRDRLDKQRNVLLFPLRTPGCKHGVGQESASQEHVFYLKYLMKQALKHDITHIALLHVDSFPVQKGWATKMAAPLSKQCMLTAVKRSEDGDQKPHPCGMLFHRSFWLKHHPPFRLSERQLKSAKYREYKKSNKGNLVADSGIGFGYYLHHKGLSWRSLPRTNAKEDHNIMGGIYGDLIFHLGGAFRPMRKAEYKNARKEAKKKLSQDPESYLRYLRG